MWDISIEDALAYIKCLVSPIRADIIMQMLAYEESKEQGVSGDLYILDDQDNWKYIAKVDNVKITEGNLYKVIQNNGAKE